MERAANFRAFNFQLPYGDQVYGQPTVCACAAYAQHRASL
jgi:hypothetical protein